MSAGDPVKDTTARRLSRLHRAVLRLSGFRIGRRLVANDMLLLTTRGRRSGRPHTVPLLYLGDDGAAVVVASWGGRDHHPDWYLNLLSNPAAQTTIDGERRPVRARTASGVEREHWWRRAVAAYPGYARYQARTEREIPIVILEERAK